MENIIMYTLMFVTGILLICSYLVFTASKILTKQMMSTNEVLKKGKSNADIQNK